MLVTICLNKFMITIFIINKLKLYFILITLTRSHLFEFVNNLKKKFNYLCNFRCVQKHVVKQESKDWLYYIIIIWITCSSENSISKTTLNLFVIPLIHITRTQTYIILYYINVYKAIIITSVVLAEKRFGGGTK